MTRFRSRIFVAILFGLITLGQAYPYSYAWANGQHSECGCNESGRKCIHGCDLKNAPRRAVTANSHQGHAGHEGHAMGADPHAHHAMPTSASVAPQDDEQNSHWVSPDCSGQTRRQILSFQCDPFLPCAVPIAFQPAQWCSVIPYHSSHPFWKVAPESPPPKLS